MFCYSIKDDDCSVSCAVASLKPNFLVVGTSIGSLLFFEIPTKGDKIYFFNEIKEKYIQGSVTSLASDKKGYILCVGDSAGNCIAFDCQDIKNLKTISSFNENQK